MQEQQEKSQAICKAGHENHHPFEVEKQVWLQITKGRLKDKKKMVQWQPGLVKLKTSSPLKMGSMHFNMFNGS